MSDNNGWTGIFTWHGNFSTVPAADDAWARRVAAKDWPAGTLGAKIKALVLAGEWKGGVTLGGDGEPPDDALEDAAIEGLRTGR